MSDYTFTDRTAAEALLPEQVANEVIKAVTEQSQALALCRNARMSSKVFRQPVLSVVPVAYWVDGDTGLKQTTAAQWKGVELVAEEIAAILPVPEAVLNDASFEIWAEVRPALAEAIAQKLDAAVFAGIEKPASWPDAIVPGAIAAGNEVTAGSTPTDEGGTLGDLGQLLDMVEADGYDVSAFLADRQLRGMLRAARDTSGQPFLDGSTTTAWDTPIHYALAHTIDPAIAIAGDWQMGVIGIRQDLTWTLLDQAALSDSDGKIILNLAQQDSVALRVVARFGFAVANPATLAGGNTDENGGWPFAVLTRAASATAKAAAKATTSKAG